MTDSEIREKVQEIVCDKLGVKPEEVTEGASIVNDLNADSLDRVDLMMALEEEFKMEIPEEEAEQIATIGDAIRYIAGKLGTTEEGHDEGAAEPQAQPAPEQDSAPPPEPDAAPAAEQAPEGPQPGAPDAEGGEDSP